MHLQHCHNFHVIFLRHDSASLNLILFMEKEKKFLCERHTTLIDSVSKILTLQTILGFICQRYSNKVGLLCEQRKLHVHTRKAVLPRLLERRRHGLVINKKAMLCYCGGGVSGGPQQ